MLVVLIVEVFKFVIDFVWLFVDVFYFDVFKLVDGCKLKKILFNEVNFKKCEF